MNINLNILRYFSESDIYALTRSTYVKTFARNSNFLYKARN